MGNNQKYVESLARRNREIIRLAKRTPCADCGQSYPAYVMDFDHVRGVKRRNISHMLTYSVDNLLDEIAKCDVVCANCHRFRTHRLGNEIEEA